MAHDYVSPAVLGHLRKHYARDVPGVRGLQLCFEPRPEWGEILTTPALQLIADTYRASLKFKHPLATALAHRKLTRAAIAEASKKLLLGGKHKLQEVPLADGSCVLGYRGDTKHIRDDPSECCVLMVLLLCRSRKPLTPISGWRVAPIPKRLQGFHDTITGPPTPTIIANASKSGVSKFMVDFEDSRCGVSGGSLFHPPPDV
jgi:hypothetical protein